MKNSYFPAKTLLGSALILLSSLVMAKNHVVVAEGSVFKPLVVKIAPGDTVSWTNMPTHMVETIEKYLPEGAIGWKSELGHNYQTKPLTAEGAYIYKCTPHWGMAMGGVIIVGEAKNMDDIKAQKPKGAEKRLYKKAVKALKK